MPDRARSEHLGVQRQLDRLAMLSPGGDTLGLDRIQALLQRLGNPEQRLPPIFHVAGTNGKGSTCAFLRAAIEAAGHTAHVYTSPHLVRFNERIRIAGKLIEDEALAALASEVLDAADGQEISFFEATTAAAFLAFSRAPANACVVEVGLGGRLDATNVIPKPAICGIAQLGIDHQAFLGNTLEAIAGEKAGIIKPGVPLVTLRYPEHISRLIADRAAAAGANVLACGTDWNVELSEDPQRWEAPVDYRDNAGGLQLPHPSLAGRHQVLNAGLAVAMLRHQEAIRLPREALYEGVDGARWPGRLQNLRSGPLRDLLSGEADLWLDGGHNPAAARAIADNLRAIPVERPVYIVLGLLENKDAEGMLNALADRPATVIAVPVPDHVHHDPRKLAALAGRKGFACQAAPSVEQALSWIAAQPGFAPLVLIAGSLYLAGEVLRKNGQVPD